MTMTGLMLHCGGDEVSFDDVQNVETPIPTRSWSPIPHADLVSQVKDTLTRTGLQVTQEQHGLDKDGDRYYGLMRVQNGSDGGDYCNLLGLRNSHDRAFSASIAFGAHVFVCDNTSFSGEIVIARKHTRWIRRDLPNLITSAVGRLGDARKNQDFRFDTYKQTELTDAQAHDLTIQALDVRAISTRTLPKVIEQWRTPDHEEFTQDGKSLWRFFNAVTESLKVVKPEYLPKRTIALHGLLDSFAGISVQAA